jgi:hypothetical protein
MRSRLVTSPLGIFVGRDNLAIAHMNDAVTVRGGLGIVRNHHHRLAEIFVRLTQHIQHNA